MLYYIDKAIGAAHIHPNHPNLASAQANRQVNRTGHKIGDTLRDTGNDARCTSNAS
ncbi:MAG: hypothetical protein U0694_18900 [Anaerolineae bacterium]